jgi:hypothetical protein
VKALKKYKWLIVFSLVVISVILLMPKTEYGIEWRNSMELQLGDALFEKEITSYVEVSNRAVTDQAYFIINNTPEGIEVESDAWKIWGIYCWVVKHIRYVEDPPGNHFKIASEVLNTGLGDCDDYAVLLASLYESSGLDAALTLVDTNADAEADHIACLVYWPSDVQLFIDEEERILSCYHMTSPVASVKIKHILNNTSDAMLGKYHEGVLLVADPIMSQVNNLMGYITCKSYEILKIFDVGR